MACFSFLYEGINEAGKSLLLYRLQGYGGGIY